MNLSKYIAQAKEIYCTYYKNGWWLSDAFMAIGEWSVYYGEGQISRAMTKETALSYMRMFNAPCVVCMRGFWRGRVIGNNDFNEERYLSFDRPMLATCKGGLKNMASTA